LTASTRWKAAEVVRAVLRDRLLREPMPAQLMAPSIRPNFCLAVAIDRRHRVGVGDVGLREHRLLADRLGRLGAGRLVDVEQYDVAAARGQDPRGGEAEPRAAAGDDERAVLDLHGLPSLVWPAPIGRRLRPPMISGAGSVAVRARISLRPCVRNRSRGRFA
jgi:hypothetical protein